MGYPEDMRVELTETEMPEQTQPVNLNVDVDDMVAQSLVKHRPTRVVDTGAPRLVNLGARKFVFVSDSPVYGVPKRRQHGTQHKYKQD